MKWSLSRRNCQRKYLSRRNCYRKNVSVQTMLFMQQDENCVRSGSTLYDDLFYQNYPHLIELGNVKFAKSVTAIFFRIKAGIKRRHHCTIKPKTSTKSILFPLAIPSEPASSNSAPPLPYPTNNSLAPLSTSSPQKLQYPSLFLFILQSREVSSSPPLILAPLPSVSLFTSITIPFPVTAHTLHFSQTHFTGIIFSVFISSYIFLIFIRTPPYFKNHHSYHHLIYLHILLRLSLINLFQ